MRKPHALKVLAPLILKPYFTSTEAKKLGVHPSVLSYYTQTGVLTRVGRGVYQARDFEGEGLFQWEDLVEAVLSVPKGVICLLSALAVYDLTEEMPRQHWIAISHRTSAKRRRHLRFIRVRNIQLGKTEIDLEGVSVSIFDRERTLIDAFRFLGRETAVKALKIALTKKGDEKINLIKLQDYAKQLRFDITPYLLSLTT